MFFRRKNRDDISASEEKSAPRVKVKGTSPDLVEAPEASAGPAAAEGTSPRLATTPETVTGAVVAPQDMGAQTPALDDDAIRLFPGFERDDFEVGFRQDTARPALLMRWKDGGEWFIVPEMFNRGILAAMDERESSNDLHRLLRNYGYDVEPTGR